MYRLRWFLLGAASLIVIAMISGTMVLWNAHGFSAREQPTAFEAWFALNIEKGCPGKGRSSGICWFGSKTGNAKPEAATLNESVTASGSRSLCSAVLAPVSTDGRNWGSWPRFPESSKRA